MYVMKNLFLFSLFALLSISVLAQVDIAKGAKVVELNDGFLTYSSSKKKGQWTLEVKKYDRDLNLLAEYSNQYEAYYVFEHILAPMPRGQEYFLFTQKGYYDSYMIWLDANLNELSFSAHSKEEKQQAEDSRWTSDKNYVPGDRIGRGVGAEGDGRLRIGDDLYELRHQFPARDWKGNKSVQGKSDYEGPTVLKKFVLAEKAGLGKYNIEWNCELPVQGNDITNYHIERSINNIIYVLIELENGENHLYTVDEKSGEKLGHENLNEKLGQLQILGVNMKDGKQLVIVAYNVGLVFIRFDENEKMQAPVHLPEANYIELYGKASRDGTLFKKGEVLFNSCHIKVTDNGYFISIPIYQEKMTVRDNDDSSWRAMGFDLIQFNKNGEFVRRGFVGSDDKDISYVPGNAYSNYQRRTFSRYLPPYKYSYYVDGEEAAVHIQAFDPRKSYYMCYSYKGKFDEVMSVTKKEQSRDDDYYLAKDLETSYKYTIGSKKEPTTFEIVPLK